MIYEARGYRYTINKRDRKITHETFTRYIALVNLEQKLIQARVDLDALPGNNRRRQREKISRLEIQIDAQRLLIGSDS